jgi:glyoxylase-like metal-dependent hydrolase (beta-lactamase superfamily II)
MFVAPRVTRMGTSLVNWYVVEDRGRLTVVDAGLPRFADDLERRLAAIGHRPSDVDAVVLTHSDSDHTGVAPTLREAGARVLIHAADEKSLRKPGPKSGDAAPSRLLRACCVRSLEALEPLAAAVLLPGHGDPWRGGAAAAVSEARRINAAAAGTRER